MAERGRPTLYQVSTAQPPVEGITGEARVNSLTTVEPSA